jgi:hypothetical protein
MKKLTIKTSLRPAVPSDVFNKKGLGNIIAEREFFYRENNGSVTGPYRIYEPFSADYYNVYINIYRLLAAQRMYVVDTQQFAESFTIHLKIKQAEEVDYLQNNLLIVNTTYFIVQNKIAKGPFYITPDTKQQLQGFVKQSQFFVFDRPDTIKEIEMLTTAQAV